eukprot:XP_028344719.1 uncharacterized protein LOC114486187 [Physeter catodon]
MLSTRSILPAVDPRSCRLKRICALIPPYQLVKLFHLACTLCFYFCCPPAGASVVLWSSCVSTSFAFLVVITSPNTNILQVVAASEPEFGTDAGRVDGYRNCSARSSSRRNGGVNSSSSRRSSRGGIPSTAAEGKNTQKQTAGKLLMAIAGDVSSSGTEAVKRGVHSQKKKSDEERRQTRLEKEDEGRRKRDSVIKEMQELLSENASWRKLQARRQAEKELEKYADEEGQLQVERFDAWKEAYSKYKKQRKQASTLQIGAAASGGLGAAGLLGLFSKWLPKGVQKPEEAKALVYVAPSGSSRDIPSAPICGPAFRKFTRVPYPVALKTNSRFFTSAKAMDFRVLPSGMSVFALPTHYQLCNAGHPFVKDPSTVTQLTEAVITEL